MSITVNKTGLLKSKVIVLSSVVIAIVAMLGITACSPAAQPAQPTGVAPNDQSAADGAARYKVETAKQRGGKLTFTGIAFGNPNDPHLVITATGRSYSMPVTNGLLKGDIYDKTYRIVPDLAKSWQVSQDGLAYTFKLQEGVKFHNAPPVNGREFTSEDAKYSLMRIAADPSVTVEKWKPRFQRRLDFGTIKSIETPDKYTLVVNLKEPYGPFLNAVAHPGTQMLPREFVETFPDKIILEGMIGTGPYTPVEYRNQQLATYKRNPDYWKKDSDGNQLPYLDELAGLYFADDQARLASFRARNLDVTTASAKKQMEAITKDMANTKAFITPALTIANFRFNMRFQPFQDVRVRRAIHLALDRHQFLELIAEGLGTISGPVTPTFLELANTMDWLLSQPGYRKDKKQDIEEARRLLKEAGYDDGLTIGVMGFATGGGTSADALALLQDQLKPLKITVKAEVVDYAGQWVPRSASQDFELSHMTHVMDIDADSLLSAHVHTLGGRNYGKFSDPTLDDLINKERQALTVEERRRWVQEAEKRILDQAPMVFLYAPANIMLVQPWVRNAGDGPVSGANVYFVEKAWMEKR